MTHKLTDLKELKTKLIDAAKSHVDKGLEEVDTHELGEVVDMIKDLAEAEEKCWKACYYKSIVEAMHEYGEEYESPESRYGYDNRRYASGRFAPKGHGHVSGFIPPDMMPHMDLEGYTPSGRGNRSQSGSEYSGSGRYGYNYDRYHEAKTNYNQTHDYQNKTEMNEFAKRHLNETVDTFKDMYEDADPELKARMKQDITKLANEMK